MPELAEVEHYRRRWNPALGAKIKRVYLLEKSRLFHGINLTDLSRALTGATFERSEAAAKQMLFFFSGKVWLGIHLGMTGELKLAHPDYLPEKHDHLVLYTSAHALVFTDFRRFGRVQFDVGSEAPKWWTSIAPALTSNLFTVPVLQEFLTRRKRAPIKAVLLMQERFPGIGNWMADEILWRAEIHPKRLAGSLTPEEVKALHKQTRWVAKEALRLIGEELHSVPQSWLFHHRWEKGGTCPKTGARLQHATIGGRTTCWSPGRQVMPRSKRGKGLRE